MGKERGQHREKIGKRKAEITMRHRVLAKWLKKVVAPLDRADLVLIASAMLTGWGGCTRKHWCIGHKIDKGSATDVSYPQVHRCR
jgi:uncharacterized protein YacL (UPF0231 family)